MGQNNIRCPELLKANHKSVSSSIIVDDDMDTNQGFNVCAQLVKEDSDLE